MENVVMEFALEVVKNPFLQAVALVIVFDTIMGVLRAIKERKFNSCVGINGAIRKVGMVLCVVFLHIVDSIIIGINLVGFIPNELWTWLGMSTPLNIGLAEFFAILFVTYEVVSILKNMALAGLPVNGLWKMVREVLSRYTTELPDVD